MRADQIRSGTHSSRPLTIRRRARRAPRPPHTSPARCPGREPLPNVLRTSRAGNGQTTHHPSVANRARVIKISAGSDAHRRGPASGERRSRRRRIRNPIASCRHPAYDRGVTVRAAPRLLGRRNTRLVRVRARASSRGGARVRDGASGLLVRRHCDRPRLEPGLQKRSCGARQPDSRDWAISNSVRGGAGASIRGDARARGRDQSDSQRMAVVAPRGWDGTGERRCFCPATGSATAVGGAAALILATSGRLVSSRRDERGREAPAAPSAASARAGIANDAARCSSRKEAEQGFRAVA